MREHINSLHAARRTYGHATRSRHASEEIKAWSSSLFVQLHDSRFQLFTVLKATTRLHFDLLFELRSMSMSQCLTASKIESHSHGCCLARQLRNCIRKQRERLDT